MNLISDFILDLSNIIFEKLKFLHRIYLSRNPNIASLKMSYLVRFQRGH